MNQGPARGTCAQWIWRVTWCCSCPLGPPSWPTPPLRSFQRLGRKLIQWELNTYFILFWDMKSWFWESSHLFFNICSSFFIFFFVLWLDFWEWMTFLSYSIFTLAVIYIAYIFNSQECDQVLFSLGTPMFLGPHGTVTPLRQWSLVEKVAGSSANSMDIIPPGKR